MVSGIFLSLSLRLQTIINDKESRALFTILVINVISALLCLLFVTLGRKDMADSDFIAYIFFCGMFGLSNYLFFGMQEYIYKIKRNGQNIFPLDYGKFFGALSLLSWVGIYISSKIIYSNELIVQTLDLFVLLFPLHAISILFRTVFEFNFKREMSALFKGFNIVAIYSRPFFNSTDMWILVTIAVFSFTSVALGLRALKFLTFKASSENISIKSILTSGFNVNFVWGYSQLIPLIEKAFFVFFLPLTVSAPLLFLSEIFQRGAIIYGMIGNFYFPRLAELVEEKITFNKYILRQYYIFVSFVILAVLSVIFVALIMPSVVTYFGGSELNPLFIGVFFTQFVCMGSFSLLVRPLYLLNKINLVAGLLFISMTIYCVIFFVVGESLTGLLAALIVHVFLDVLMAICILKYKEVT